MNASDTDHLRTYFLAFGPALRMTGLNRRLNLPERTIYDWLRGQPLPEKHREKVERWARWFGYDETRQYEQFI